MNDNNIIVNIKTPTGRVLHVSLDKNQVVRDIKCQLALRVDIGIDVRFLVLCTQEGNVVNDTDNVVLYDGTCLLLSMAGHERDATNEEQQHDQQQQQQQLLTATNMILSPLLVRLSRWDMRIRRTAAANRILGLVSVLVGVVFFGVGVNRKSWMSVVIGLSLIQVGVLGIRSSQHVGIPSARSYYRGVVAFVLLLVVLSIVEVVVDDSISLKTVLISSFLPVLACTTCVFCAKRHYTLVCAREEIMANVLDIPELVSDDHDDNRNMYEDADGRQFYRV